MPKKKSYTLETVKKSKDLDSTWKAVKGKIEKDYDFPRVKDLDVGTVSDIMDATKKKAAFVIDANVDGGVLDFACEVDDRKAGGRWVLGRKKIEDWDQYRQEIGRAGEDMYRHMGIPGI